MNLLINLHLTYKPCKNFNFFPIFTYNQGKVFLILPITWGGGGGHLYIWSPLGVSSPCVNDVIIQSIFWKRD